MAGVGYGEGVGGVEVFGSLLKAEYRLEDGSDLLFGGIAVAGDVLLDDGGLVFGDGEVARDGGSYGHTLCPAEF